MKKIVLSFLFIFIAGNLMNANTNEEVLTPWCWEYADGLANAWKKDNPSATYEEEYDFFTANYLDCDVNTNNPNPAIDP